MREITMRFRPRSGVVPAGQSKFSVLRVSPRTLVPALAILCWIFSGSDLFAQKLVSGTEVLAKDRPEAWAMKLIGSELLMVTGVPRDVKPWSIQASLEAGWIPSLDAGQRLIGFDGTKEENANRTPAYVRPQLLIGLPNQFSVALGYIPPVRLGGIRPHHLSWSLGRPLVSGPRWRLGGRVLGQVGNLSGDITCDQATVAAGPDRIRNPFACEAPSDDKMTVRAVGVELGSAFKFTEHLEPFVAAGWNYFDNDFQVNARYSGLLDKTFLTTSGPTFSLTVGVGYHLTERARINLAAFYTPLIVQRQGVRTNDGLFNVRVSLDYLVR